MAVSSMQAVNVIGLVEHIDEVITVLGESGVFHPDEVGNFYSNTQGFTHLQTNNSYAESLTNLRTALNQTKREFELIDSENYNPPFEVLENLSSSIVKDIEALLDDKRAAKEQLSIMENGISVAQHFAGIDVETQKVLNMKYMKARFGRLPKESLEKLHTYRKKDEPDFVVCTEDDTHYWGLYFVPEDRAAKTDKFFERLYFEPAELESDELTPMEQMELYRKQIPLLEQQAEEADKKLEEYLDGNEEQIKRCLSKLEELYLYSGIRSKALQHGSSFIIVGWIPTENKKELRNRLKTIKSVDLDFSDAKNELDKNPPVKLKNHFFAKPFEFYTQMYGVPKYNEIDPTLFVAVTYIVIFGIMFADLGQGLILSIVGLLMWRFKRMAVGKILFPCGISAMVFGTIFGSVFGFEHLLDPMFRLFGFEEKPIEVMASQNTNTIIVSAIGIGVFLLIVAMFLNVYTSIRQKNYGRALFSTSGVAGIIFYSAIVFGLIAEMFLGLHIMTAPYIICLIVIPFILIFFAEPLGKLVNGEKDWQPES